MARSPRSWLACLAATVALAGGARVCAQEPLPHGLEAFAKLAREEQAAVVERCALQATDLFHELLHRAVAAAGSDEVAAGPLAEAALAFARAVDARLGSGLAREAEAVLSAEPSVRQERVRLVLALRDARRSSAGAAEDACAALLAYAEEHKDAEARRAALLHRSSMRRGRMTPEARAAEVSALLARLREDGLSGDEMGVLAAIELCAIRIRLGHELGAVATALGQIRSSTRMDVLPPSTRAQVLSLEAEIHLRMGSMSAAEASVAELEETIAHFEAHAPLEPSAVDAVSEWERQVALVRAAAGDHVAAVATLERTSARKGHRPLVRARLLVALSREHLAAGSLHAIEDLQPEIESSLRRAESDEPGQPLVGLLGAQATIVRGEAWVRRGHPEKARVHLGAIEPAADWPPELRADLGLAWGLLSGSEGNLDESISAFEGVLRGLPGESAAAERVAAHIALARMHVATGSIEAAAEHAHRALSAARSVTVDRALLLTLAEACVAHVELSRKRPVVALDHILRARESGRRVLPSRRDISLELDRLGLEAAWQKEGFDAAPSRQLLVLAQGLAERAAAQTARVSPSEAAEVLKLHELWQELELASEPPSKDAASSATAWWKDMARGEDMSPASFEWDEARSVLHSILGRRAEADGRREEAVRHYRSATRIESEMRRGLGSRVADGLSLRFESLHDRLVGLLLESAVAAGTRAWAIEALESIEDLRAQGTRALIAARRRARVSAPAAEGLMGWAGPGTPLLDGGGLPPGRTALLYSVNSRGVFVVAVRGSSVRALELPIGTRELERRVLALLANLGSEGDRYSAQALVEDSGALYDALVAPVLAEVKGARELVIVADGPLERLPFGVLAPAPSGAAAPVDFCRHPFLAGMDGLRAIVTVPSLGVLGQLESLPPPEPALEALLVGPPAIAAEGWPALDASGGDIAVWEPLLPSKDRVRLAGRDATLANLLAARPGRFRFLHFATHMQERLDRPTSPALLLAGDDGKGPSAMRPSDVASLELPEVSLVVLAACSTTRGDQGGLEGSLGLPRAFLVAGARSVLATAGPVRDRSARPLLSALATRLCRSPEDSPAVSLLSAIRDLRSRPETAWPGNWAPFILFGRP